MQVIPVIDLKAGQVVHARGGVRDSYAPISSPLTDSSAPEAVVAALLSLHPFEQLYVADLDAIEGCGDHRAVLQDLRRRFPALQFWVDRGFHDAAACRDWLAADLGDPVLGSESMADVTFLEDLAAECRDDRVLLSLDFRGDEFQGPPDLLARPQLWPRRILVMTLARVGAALGPDFDRLSVLRSRAPDRSVFAAGGVRGKDDLLRLHGMGAAGALVASCLHKGNLTASELENLRTASGD